jgi:site-specific DNA recombinase
MAPLQTAWSARVASAHQAAAPPIARQGAAWRARVTTDGRVVPASLAFLDAGSSGAPLVRPAVERWREAAAAGRMARLDGQAPDRLARTYA